MKPSMHIEKYENQYENFLTLYFMARLTEEPDNMMIVEMELENICEILFALTGIPRWDTARAEWNQKAGLSIAAWRNLRT